MLEKIIEIYNKYPSYTIAIGLIASIAMVFSIVSSWIIKKRVRYASMFGRCEHSSGRLLGLALIVTFSLEWFKIGYTLYGIGVCFGIWAVYLISHTLEKFCYGHYGSRG